MAVEIVKCTNCKGTGHVPTNTGSGKWTTCPICKGTGKKKIYTNQTKTKQGGKTHGKN